jgi:uncharacterized protein YndB with AHSA1/START domain
MRLTEFTIDIQATPEIVWYILWNDFNYRKWVSAFCEGSFAISTWQEGAGIHFLAPDGRGMYSKIKTLVPNQQMSFEHLGNIVDFLEQPLDEESKAWTGGTENYYLTATEFGTTLRATVDVIEEYEDYFNEKFPKALQLIRLLSENPSIKVEAIIDAPLEKVWEYWTSPQHIINWNFASPDWHCPNVENDLRAGGAFSYTMAAKDGSMSFDFNGNYNEVLENQRIVYHIEDGRKVEVNFSIQNDKVKIVEIFETENMNSLELQEMGWQAILNNFTNYVQNKE